MTFHNALAQTRNLINHVLGRRAISTTPVIVLGFSGGPDSVFLFHLLHTLHEQGFLQLIAAHLDHGWRSNSADDAVFCQQLCTTYNIPLVVSHGSQIAVDKKYNGSREEIGRIMRRTFFEQVRQRYNAHFIVLAHHLDDQAETFMMRLIRGTSLQGLHGMDTVDGIYIRPLLAFPKKDLVDYLEINKLAYVIDPSNDSETFLRNNIRKQVIPALRRCDERFNQNFTRSIALLKAEDAFLSDFAARAFSKVFAYNESTGYLVGDKTVLQQQDPIIAQRIIQQWFIATKIPFTITNSVIAEALRFLNNPHGGSHQLAPTFIIQKKQKSFWVSRSMAH